MIITTHTAISNCPGMPKSVHDAFISLPVSILRLPKGSWPWLEYRGGLGKACGLCPCWIHGSRLHPVHLRNNRTPQGPSLPNRKKTQILKTNSNSTHFVYVSYLYCNKTTIWKRNKTYFLKCIICFYLFYTHNFCLDMCNLHVAFKYVYTYMDIFPVHPPLFLSIPSFSLSLSWFLNDFCSIFRQWCDPAGVMQWFWSGRCGTSMVWSLKRSVSLNEYKFNETKNLY